MFALNAEHEDRTVASIVALTDTIKVTMRDPNVAWHRFVADRYVAKIDLIIFSHMYQ